MMLGWFAASGRQGQSFLSASPITLSVCGGPGRRQRGLARAGPMARLDGAQPPGPGTARDPGGARAGLDRPMLIPGVTLTLFALGVIDLPQEVQTSSLTMSCCTPSTAA